MQTDIESITPTRNAPHLYVEYNSGRVERYSFKPKADGSIPKDIEKKRDILAEMSTAKVVKIVGVAK